MYANTGIYLYPTLIAVGIDVACKVIPCATLTSEKSSTDSSSVVFLSIGERTTQMSMWACIQTRWQGNVDFFDTLRETPSVLLSSRVPYKNFHDSVLYRLFWHKWLVKFLKLQLEIISTHSLRNFLGNQQVLVPHDDRG